MSELNREQIIKALECCYVTYNCNGCPLYDKNNFSNGCIEHVIPSALALIKELTEDNERLRGILLQFTDIVHKWGNKNGYDTSEISLVPILNEESAIKLQIKADTVHKMQILIKERCIKGGIYPAFVAGVIDQVAKEMLEG